MYANIPYMDPINSFGQLYDGGARSSYLCFHPQRSKKRLDILKIALWMVMVEREFRFENISFRVQPFSECLRRKWFCGYVFQVTKQPMWENGE